MQINVSSVFLMYHDKPLCGFKAGEITDAMLARFRRVEARRLHVPIDDVTVMYESADFLSRPVQIQLGSYGEAIGMVSK